MYESQTLATDADPFVRPRFSDGTFDDPLLLLEHFAEEVLPGALRRPVMLIGPRGSGVTTALRGLAQVARREGRPVIELADLDAAPASALLRLLETLAEADPVVILDRSVTPLPPLDRWRERSRFFATPPPDELRARLARVQVVVGGGRELGGATWLRSWLQPLISPQELVLSSWSGDELLELLGSCERYRAARSHVFSLLRGVPALRPLLLDPRTAVWLVDAALQLEHDPRRSAEETLCGLYANLLDRLRPETLRRLLVLRGQSYPREFVWALLRGEGLDSVRFPEPDAADELCAMFRVDAELAHEVFDAGYDLVRRSFPVAKPPRIALAVPGLQDFLQAGCCLQDVAREEVPAEVDSAWLPYVGPLLRPPQREILRRWLEENRLGAASAAATLLWAAGERPPLDGAGRSLAKVQLPGAPLAGVRLPGAWLYRANLDAATLEGADLSDCSAPDLRARAASFAGADLRRAVFKSAQLARARFSGARAAESLWESAILDGAEFRGAGLERASFEHVSLNEVSFERALLQQARIFEAELRGASLRGADLSEASLERLNLVEVDLERARLTGATLQACALTSQQLQEQEASAACFFGCELSGTRFERAILQGVHFAECRAHEASFEGADLRDAVFRRVSFHAGSSRSGLLLNAPASEGTRTGYYSEGSTDDAWASPESIRQASFRGADLRGAVFLETDLFRIDFRGARLSPELREQASKSGAIL